MAFRSSSSAAGEFAPIRFRMRPGLEITAAIDPETGKEKCFVKDRRSGDVFHLGAEEYFVCQQLDGTSSFGRIQAAFATRFGQTLSPAQFEALLREFEKADLIVEFGDFGGQSGVQSPGPEAGALPSAGPAAGPRGFSLRLFDPTSFLDLVAGLFGFLRHAPALLVPGAIFACLILASSQVALATDLRAIELSFPTAVKLLAAIMFVSFIAKLAQGAVARRFGAEVKEFGIRLALGVVPQFHVDRGGVGLLTKRERLWVLAAPLLARLSLFIAGAFVWIIFRQTSDTIGDAAFFVGQVGFWSLIVTAIPLLPTDGYLWFSTLVDRPDILDRSARVIEMRLKGQRLPDALSVADRRLLTLFGGAALLVVGAGLSVAVIMGGAFLERRLGGVGVAFLLVIIAVGFMWVRYTWRVFERMRRRPIAPGAAKVVAIQGQRQRVALAPAGGTIISGAARQAASGGIPRAWSVAAFIALIIGALALIPYRFEAGGDFIILPTVRVEVRARIDGVVEKIHFNEGDQVEAGELIAELGVWEEQRDLESAGAALLKAEAELRALEAGSTVEAIATAKARVEAARVRADVSRQEYERMRTLGEQGVVPAKQAAIYRGEYLKNKADLETAQATLRQVQASTPIDILDAARAEVERLKAQVAFSRQAVEAARIVAPISGRIVTDNIELKVGSYLMQGGLLAIVEDSSVAQAQILVPQTSIAEVEIGDSVRLKPWGYSATELKGTVVSIAPAAEATERGQFIRVKTNIDNSLGILKPQMTGYAKIDGSTMSVLEAFTRIYVRFLRIEVWSWIP